MMRRFRQFPQIGGKRGGIPSGWVEVEYIRSTGNQWIDLGVSANLLSKYKLDFKLNTVQPAKGIFGSFATNRCFHVYVSSVANNYFQFGIGTWENSTVKGDTEKHHVEYGYTGAYHVYIDGNLGYLTMMTSMNDSVGLALFTLKREDGSVYEGADVNVYSFEIETDTKSLCLVPVRNTTTNEGAMCDVLTGDIYRNAGSGEFVVGPDKALPYARVLDLVRPLGYYGFNTWRVITNIPLDDDFGIEVELARMVNASADVVAIGSRNNSVSSNSRMFLGGYNNLYYWGWNTLTTYSGLKTNVKYTQGLNFLNSRTETLNGNVVASNLPTHVDMGGAVLVFPCYCTSPQTAEDYRNSGNSQYYAFGRTRVSRGNRIVADFIPVELDDGTITFYDQIAGSLVEKHTSSTLGLEEIVI